ncbi:MAG TPA: nitrophenyl compound nitroreductase subunit ArsF family protein [Sedimentisphaerales bacterium]|nr:nitrophenyl compound nitroreductase subunit ArsF family protein [Sedimentisphaerales bacterium]
MNYRSILVALLLICVSISSGCQNVKQSDRPVNEIDPKSTSVTRSMSDNERTPQHRSRTVVAYYFHRTFRCPSCLAIEALSLEALQSGFEQALRDGTMEWVTVNVDEPGGEDFVNEFDLATSSLVIVEMESKKQVKWKKLEEVWKLKDDRDAFVQYVRDEVAAYLAGD